MVIFLMHRRDKQKKSAKRKEVFAMHKRSKMKKYGQSETLENYNKKKEDNEDSPHINEQSK